MIFYEWYSYVEHYAYESKVVLNGEDKDYADDVSDHATLPDFLLKDFAKPVAEEDRANFLWDMFGGIPNGMSDAGTFEWLLFNEARDGKGYDGGGRWEMMKTLDGKAFFMYPTTEDGKIFGKEIHFLSGNYKNMDAKAFGLACTLSALRDMSEEGNKASELYLDLQDALWKLCYEYLEKDSEDFKTLLNKRGASYEQITEVYNLANTLCDTVEYLV